jgi:hypothetical protein
MKEINLEHLYAIPAFEHSFKEERFKNEAETFLGHVNTCVSKNIKDVIGDLLKCACEYKQGFMDERGEIRRLFRY